ncbi:MAG: hypothetical protein U9Q81_17235 [Pseudomonadota bacterium]|nr:hypothetical protein [Pseudomonadota bacterium]
MKAFCCTTAALLLLIIGVVGYKLLVLGETRPAENGRSAIQLDPGERDLVLAEMRAFLQSVQIITQSLTDEDLTGAAAAAQKVGRAAAGDVPVSLMAKLPMGFKELGLSTHRAFDELALDAEQLGDPAHTLGQLATLLGNCVGCHAAFRIETTQ